MTSFCKFCKASLPVRKPGSVGRRRLFCNDFCSRRFNGKASSDPLPVACLFCGGVLVHKTRPKKYCSKKHSDKARAVARKKVKVTKSCVNCFVSFESSMSKQKFCSTACRKIVQSIQQSQRWRANNPIPENFVYQCDDCSVLVERDYLVRRGAYGRFCDVCRLHRKRARYRMKTVRRQSLTVKPSRLSCDEVAARDNYVCHICDGWVDMSLPRTIGLGATVDHVIPLSKGGSDEPENLRLAHWACNVRKGSKVHG